MGRYSRETASDVCDGSPPVSGKDVNGKQTWLHTLTAFSTRNYSYLKPPLLTPAPTHKQRDRSPTQGGMEQTTASSKRTTTPPTALLLLLLLNIFLMLLGIGGPLLLRLYFLHGGSRLWLSSFLQSAGFPVLLVPILLHSFLNRRRPFRQLPSSVFAAAAFFGLLYGLDAYLFGYGSSCLPLSTSSLLGATQLSFTALFAFLVNRQRFTAYSINAVVLLTIGPIVLGLSSSTDRPAGESNGRYYLGFAMSLAAAVLVGLMLPLMERMYKLVKEGLSYAMVLEIQLVIGVFGSAFCLVGMAISKDFQAIAREARGFGLGETKYYLVVTCDAVLFQVSILGLFGVVYSASSSLFAGILNAAILPVSEILAVITFREKFNGSKGVALTLCLWGFTSYLYGERRQNQKLKKRAMERPASMP